MTGGYRESTAVVQRQYSGSTAVIEGQMGMENGELRIKRKLQIDKRA
jgi:hypothetical protein